MYAFVAFVFAAAFSCGSLNAISAKAATTPTYDTFKMENGAAVRIQTVEQEDGSQKETNGIRFSADISADEYTALTDYGAKFGFIIVAKDILGNTELEADTVFGENSAFYFGASSEAVAGKKKATNVRAEYTDIDDDGTKELCGALTNLIPSNLTRAFVGRGYVAIPSASETVTNEDGTTQTVVTAYEYHFAPYYADDGNIADDIKNNTRSMYYIAQKAIEAKDANSAVLQEKYISVYSSNNYKYIVNYHYTALDGTETSVTEGKYAPLNSSVDISGSIQEKVTYQEKEYQLSSVANAGKPRSGLVYATILQEFDVYYNEVGANVQTKLEDMLTADGASAKYFNSTMEYVDNQLSSTDKLGNWSFLAPGRKTVTFNKAFLAELRAIGVQTLRVKTIYATVEGLAGIFFDSGCVAITSGYGTQYHFSSRENDVTDTSTQKLIGTLTVSEGKTYLTTGSDGYIYFDIRNVTGDIVLTAYEGSTEVKHSGSEAMVDWSMDDFSVLTQSVDELTGDGLIIIK